MSRNQLFIEITYTKIIFMSFLNKFIIFMNLFMILFDFNHLFFYLDQQLSDITHVNFIIK
jgi:hypothetical protein